MADNSISLETAINVLKQVTGDKKTQESERFLELQSEAQKKVLAFVVKTRFNNQTLGSRVSLDEILEHAEGFEPPLPKTAPEWFKLAGDSPGMEAELATQIDSLFLRGLIELFPQEEKPISTRPSLTHEQREEGLKTLGAKNPKQYTSKYRGHGYEGDGDGQGDSRGSRK